MGIDAIFRCNNCDNKFRSKSGGGFTFRLIRCEKCDRLKQVDIDKTEGICASCGGQLREDLNPMCPKCKSRDTEPGDEGWVCMYD